MARTYRASSLSPRDASRNAPALFEVEWLDLLSRSVKEQGPYWYFRYQEEGKQKKLYLGKTNDPEGELAQKRA